MTVVVAVVVRRMCNRRLGALLREEMKRSEIRFVD